MDAAILDAIPGANPSGENLRYELIYREIRKRARRARGEAFSHPGDLDYCSADEDWRFVALTCRDLLMRRSKDLMLAAWLTEAQLAVDGLSGLRDGLDILRGLIEAFWETLYPEIEDGDAEARMQIFEWIDTHLDRAVEGAINQDLEETSPSDKEMFYRHRLLSLIDCRDSLVTLNDVCNVKVGRREVFPNLKSAIFGAMRKTVQSLASVTEKRSAIAAGALTARFRDWITRADLEDFLRHQLFLLEKTAACEDDERMHANNDTVASLPSPPTYSSPPPSMAPPIPAQDHPVRIRDSSKGMGQRRPPVIASPVVSRQDRVEFTLTAPANVTAKVTFELFVWAHTPDERSKVIARAREELNVRDMLARSKGPFNIARGTILNVRLTIPGAVIDEPEDTMMWEGESSCASFLVTLSSLGEGGKSPGVAHIYANGVKLARISFVLSEAGLAEVSGVRYRKAFASYASADRDAVLGRIQGIHKVAPELEIFLDVLSLRSGQNWETELWRVIPASDIFYLFWSTHARDSDWVEKEWRCALRERGIEFIDPIPLVSPRESPPPPELSSLHFNDWELAFQRGKQ
jgi:hypothetical protein